VKGEGSEREEEPALPVKNRSRAPVCHSSDAAEQDDWWLCMVTKKSCTKLKMSEFDETFSDERATPEVSFLTKQVQ